MSECTSHKNTKTRRGRAPQIGAKLRHNICHFFRQTAILSGLLRRRCATSNRPYILSGGERHPTCLRDNKLYYNSGVFYVGGREVVRGCARVLGIVHPRGDAQRIVVLDTPAVTPSSRFTHTDSRTQTHSLTHSPLLAVPLHFCFILLQCKPLKALISCHPRRGWILLPCAPSTRV